MITIDQLLESVDLKFEPRFVTKDKNGMIKIFEHKPKKAGYYWLDDCPLYSKVHISFIKLAEFVDKDWTECIYEVPRKTTGKIKKIEVYGTLLDYKFEPTQKFEPMTFMELIKKINELVDIVNKHSDKIQQIGD